MAYTWTTGETITADNLNKTGQTIVFDFEYDGGNPRVLDMTYKQIHDHLLAGDSFYLRDIASDGSEVIYSFASLSYDEEGENACNISFTNLPYYFTYGNSSDYPEEDMG